MRLTNIKSKEVVKILQRQGFKIDRQSGTHIIMKKENQTVVVPVHKETIPIGTLKSIERQANVNFREIIEE
jgi:predicted RNA binding protein YcfA (HicA-like mRNA interferase family)